jgi:2,4-dienoyl-CoA reductase (NADPH2)
MAVREQYQRLLEPGFIGRVRTRNRIIKTASGYGLAEPDGSVGNASIALYERMAKGGVGLIIFEFTTVEYPRGARRPTSAEARMDDDKYIAGFSRLTKAVHDQGCPIFLQIMHSGPWYVPQEGRAILGDRISASALSGEEFRGLAELQAPDMIIPRALSIAEIEDLINKFAQAAERAQKAGFDGVEINGSHHHLINTFFSRVWNRRHDAYGCDSLENRSRFMCDITRRVKERCGQDYPVGALFNAVELGHERGTTLEEGKNFARMLQDAGADAIQARAAGYGSFGVNLLHAERLLHPELPENLKVKELDWSRKGRGFSVPIGTAVKAAVSVPVFVAGRLDPEMGEELLRQNKLDFIGMTRRLLADPELPRKVAEARLGDIAPCSGCLYCWHERAYLGKPIRCRINASLGRELEYVIKPADKKKKVIVAGGGPAGLEAARVAALRGHDVLLFEKAHQLGGLMPLAAIVKDLEGESILDTVRYLKRQISKLGVTVTLAKEVDSSLIEEVRPAAVIIAVGGSAQTPDIPGIDNEKVVSSSKLHGKLQTALRSLGAKSLERLTKLWMPVGKVVVIIGGGVQGCQLAEFLIKRGRKVTLVDTAETLGEGLLAEDPFRLFPWLEEKGATLLAGVTYERITDDGLVITTREGKQQILKADSILTALPLLPNPDVATRLGGEEASAAIYQIGDCKEAGFMHDAIADGFRVGALI